MGALYIGGIHVYEDRLENTGEGDKHGWFIYKRKRRGMGYYSLTNGGAPPQETREPCGPFFSSVEVAEAAQRLADEDRIEALLLGLPT